MPPGVIVYPADARRHNSSCRHNPSTNTCVVNATFMIQNAIEEHRQVCYGTARRQHSSGARERSIMRRAANARRAQRLQPLRFIVGVCSRVRGIRAMRVRASTPPHVTRLRGARYALPACRCGNRQVQAPRRERRYGSAALSRVCAARSACALSPLSLSSPLLLSFLLFLPLPSPSLLFSSSSSSSSSYGTGSVLKYLPIHLNHHTTTHEHTSTQGSGLGSEHSMVINENHWMSCCNSSTQCQNTVRTIANACIVGVVGSAGSAVVPVMSPPSPVAIGEYSHNITATPTISSSQSIWHECQNNNVNTHVILPSYHIPRHSCHIQSFTGVWYSSVRRCGRCAYSGGRCGRGRCVWCAGKSHPLLLPQSRLACPSPSSQSTATSPNGGWAAG